MRHGWAKGSSPSRITTHSCYELLMCHLCGLTPPHIKALFHFKPISRWIIGTAKIGTLIFLRISTTSQLRTWQYGLSFFKCCHLLTSPCSSKFLYTTKPGQNQPNRNIILTHGLPWTGWQTGQYQEAINCFLALEAWCSPFIFVFATQIFGLQFGVSKVLYHSIAFSHSDYSRFLTFWTCP